MRGGFYCPETNEAALRMGYECVTAGFGLRKRRLSHERIEALGGAIAEEHTVLPPPEYGTIIVEQSTVTVSTTPVFLTGTLLGAVTVLLVIFVFALLSKS